MEYKYLAFEVDALMDKLNTDANEFDRVEYEEALLRVLSREFSTLEDEVMRLKEALVAIAGGVNSIADGFIHVDGRLKSIEEKLKQDDEPPLKSHFKW